MRAVLNGKYKLHELSSEFIKLIENLEANGVEEVDFVNVYFTPLAFDRTMRFYNAHGDEIEIIRFKYPAPKEFVPVTDGIKAESKGGTSPKEAARIRRLIRGDVAASHTLDPTSEEFLQSLVPTAKRPDAK